MLAKTLIQIKKFNNIITTQVEYSMLFSCYYYCYHDGDYYLGLVYKCVFRVIDSVY